MTDGVTRADVDKTMWLVTLADIITNNSTRREENLVVILSREESWDPASERNSDALYRASCIMTLYLADTEQTKTQTFTANYWPLLSSLHLFTEEFRLEERLRGTRPGYRITQQFVLWARCLPPETRVLPIEISRVDEEKRRKQDPEGQAVARNGVPVPGRGNPLNAAAGRRTAVAAGQVFNAPGGATGIRGTPSGRLLSRAAGKKSCSSKAKNGRKKQLIASHKNRPFYHLWHRKGGPAPGREM